MKVDNQTLNFLSRGAEFAQGPRGTSRPGEQGFGVLFDTASKPLEPSRRTDATAAAAGARSTERTAQRESSDDRVEAVQPGEADAAERDVEETESRRPGDGDQQATDQRPEVGNAESRTKANDGGDGGKRTDAPTAEAEKKPENTAKTKVATVTGPASDRGVVATAKGEPTTDAEKAAKVLDQLRQPPPPEVESEQAKATAASGDEAAAKPAAPSARSELPAVQAPAAANEAKPTPPPTTPPPTNASVNGDASPPGTPALSTQNELGTQTGNGESSGDGRRSGEGDGRSRQANKAAVNANAFQPAPVDGETPAQASKTANEPAEPTVRLAGTTVHVTAAEGQSGPPQSLGSNANAAGGVTAGSAGQALPEADASRVTDRVVKSLHTMAANRGGTVTLRLTPPDLGTLRIQVNMSGGGVTATFEASTAAVGRALEANTASLRHALESQGLTVERINVQVNQSHSSNASAQQNAGDSPTDGRSRGMTDGGRQNADDRQSQDQRQPQRSFSETLDLVA